MRGPRDSGTVAPGDLITLTFDLTNEDGLAYPCFGLVGDHGVVGAAPQITIYYLKPTRDFHLEMSAQIPTSLKPGTVVHFSAYVVASPCPRDLARLDFDVKVG